MKSGCSRVSALQIKRSEYFGRRAVCQLPLSIFLRTSSCSHPPLQPGFTFPLSLTSLLSGISIHRDIEDKRAAPKDRAWVIGLVLPLISSASLADGTFSFSEKKYLRANHIGLIVGGKNNLTVREMFCQL